MRKNYNNELFTYLSQHGIDVSHFLRNDKSAYMFELPTNLLPRQMRIMLKDRLLLIIKELNRITKYIQDYIEQLRV